MSQDLQLQRMIAQAQAQQQVQVNTKGIFMKIIHKYQISFKTHNNHTLQAYTFHEQTWAAILSF